MYAHLCKVGVPVIRTLSRASLPSRSIALDPFAPFSGICRESAGDESGREGDGWSPSDAICVWKLTRRRDAEFSGEVSLCVAAAVFNRTGGGRR